MNTSDTITLRVTRRFDAPAERVFDAWLDPALVARWLFATPGGTMLRVDIDARIGGGFHIAEQRAEGVADHYGRYRELDRPRRIVFDFWTDPEDADSPARVIVDIAPDGTGCGLTLTQHMPARYAEYAERSERGWATLLALLAQRLAVH